MLDQGVDNDSVAKGFIASAEFTALYGQDVTNHHFVSKLYQHVLHRGPDGAGFDYWVDALGRGFTREYVLNEFSQSKENVAQVVAAIQNGIEYLPFG